MHEWERQDKLLERVEQMQVESCLEYNTFEYEKHEWDNIPGIVPRYIIYLSKYMAGISAVCNEFDKRETTGELRTAMLKQIGVTDSNLSEFKSDHQKQKNEMTDTIT